MGIKLDATDDAGWVDRMLAEIRAPHEVRARGVCTLGKSLNNSLRRSWEGRLRCRTIGNRHQNPNPFRIITTQATLFGG
ncbi:MAG: hypothetical protein M2R45_02036 [Verrucomicrobia subdivision 3 bacterium]|nr:hypothetical protein [Limisphaerales bacterium]MCS1414855.1 hypothetical protein [Limisphaerales bacterium]